MSIPIAFQCLSSFHLKSSMVLLCTVSCGRLFQSRGALIVKKFFRISRFALRTTTLHALSVLVRAGKGGDSKFWGRSFESDTEQNSNPIWISFEAKF